MRGPRSGMRHLVPVSCWLGRALLIARRGMTLAPASAVMRPVPKRHPRSISGSAIVELAVVGPLLVLMVLGVADFGRVLYTSIILSHAARAGAQYGAQTNATTS